MMDSLKLHAYSNEHLAIRPYLTFSTKAAQMVRPSLLVLLCPITDSVYTDTSGTNPHTAINSTNIQVRIHRGVFAVRFSGTKPAAD